MRQIMFGFMNNTNQYNIKKKKYHKKQQQKKKYIPTTSFRVADSPQLTKCG